MKPPTSKREFKEIRITAEGWIFLIVLSFISVGAVLRNVNLLILMAGMMFAPLIINWRLGVLWMKTLSAKRNMPRRIHAQQLAPIQWSCHNQAGLSAWNVEIRDHVQMHESDNDTWLTTTARTASRPSWIDRWRRLQLFFSSSQPITGSDIRVELPPIGPGRSESVTYRAYYQKRGRYLMGPAMLATRFPFGLIACRFFLPEQQPVYVAPAIGTLVPSWERQMRSSVAGSDAVQRRRGLEEDEFYALRPWRSGDSRKQIHWRTSAKFGFPIVKQHEQPDNRDFAMLLDLYAAPWVENDELDSDPDNMAAAAEFRQNKCETALSFAATVLLELGTAVRGNIAMAICGFETVVCQHRNQREVVERSMQELAIAKQTSHPELIQALLELALCVAPETPLYVISSRTLAPELSFLKNLPRQTTAEDSPSSLEPRTVRRLESVWPMVRWITVDSAEFQELFYDTRDANHSKLNAFASKWSTQHAPR